MSRTTRYKIGYVLVLAALSCVAAAIVLIAGGGMTAIITVVIVALIPGRIQGYFYRDLFRGRRLLGARRPTEAIPHFGRFVTQLREHPWQKRLLWLSWSVYTPNAEAMALNNLGAAHMETGAWTEAQALLREALRLDPLYPLPHVNLAILFSVRGERDAAEISLREAAKLGYTGGTIDKIVYAGQSILARVEGQGPKARAKR